MFRNRASVLLCGFLLASLVGCGSHTVAFQVDDVINTGGKGPAARDQLDVDIIAVTPEDDEAFPELADGTWYSDDWFAARDQGNDPRVRKLAKRIYALRNGESGPNDVLKGQALVSGRDTNDTRRTVEIKHPAPMGKRSAIVIYGRFHDGQGGLADVPPVVIQPPPGWNKDILISVGPTGMTRLEAEK